MLCVESAAADNRTLYEPGTASKRARLMLLAVLCLMPAGRASYALINPDFTPVHLTRESDVILHLRVGAADDDGMMRAGILESIKGEWHEKSMNLTADDEIRSEIADFMFRGRETLDAMAFLSGADAEDAHPSFGHFTLDGTWFGIELDAEDTGIWRLDADLVDMKAVWDGRVDMLRGCVELLLKMPVPEIPVAVGAEWAHRERIGEIEGAVHRLIAVRLHDGAPRMLAVAADSGDRCFVFDPDEKAYRDITGELGITTASEALEFADVDGDGRLDLLSCRDGSLSVYLQSESGSFGEAASSAALPGACLAITTAGFGGAAPLIILSTDDRPLVTQWDADRGELSAPRPLVPGDDDFPGAQYGAARECVVADFTGNALPDLLQPFERGGLIYRGREDGGFDAPTPVGEISSGRGPARVEIGDFDGSGKPDVIIAGDSGHTIWLNQGDGSFIGANHTGEPDYIALRECSDVTVGELNNDGRHDFVLAYRGAMAHPFFNRGFSTFGFAITMDFSMNDFFPDARLGQQALLLEDINEDGAQELVMVMRDGSVWVLSSNMEARRRLSVRLLLAGESATTGPVNVTAYSGVRPLGARTLTAGRREAFFGMERPGPLTLRWQFPGHDAQETVVTVTRGQVRLVPGPEGPVSPP